MNIMNNMMGSSLTTSGLSNLTAESHSTTSENVNLSSTNDKTISGTSGASTGAGAIQGMYLEDKNELTTFYASTDESNIVGTYTFDRIPHAESALSDVLSFLKRPVKIYTFDWLDTGGTYTFQQDPWLLYFSNVAISRKLANYYMINTGGMKLHITSVGNPYLFGRFYMAYWPWASHDAAEVTRTLTLEPRVKLSHLPCFCEVDPSGNTVNEMILPESQRRKRLITSGYSLGSIVGAVAANLQSCSTLTPSVQIVVYASLINPELQGVTTSPPAYATSQEWKGVISKPLANLAKNAAIASTIPMIRPYATAVGMAASTGSSIAKMFGFSKPPDMKDSQVVIQHDIGNMVNTDGVDNTTVLALDRNAVTTIDPGTLGLPPQDEMALAHILSRPSLCTTFNWSYSVTTGTTIYAMYNSPHTCLSYDNVSGSNYYTPLTNLAYVCGMFYNTRGTIKYRIEFCASKFHTGTIQILYEPATYVSTLDSTNVTKNWVVDLAQQTTLEIEIPYYNRDYATAINDGTSMLGSSALSQNTSTGFLYFKCITPIKCGSTLTTSVDVLVYNCAGNDFCVSTPTSLLLRNQNYGVSWHPQATWTLASANSYANWATSEEVAFGIVQSESVHSIRNLMKRYVYEREITVTCPNNEITYAGGRGAPPYVGTVPGYSSTTVQKFNGPMTPFAYWAISYVFQRGGFRHKYVRLDSNNVTMKAVFGTSVSNMMTGTVLTQSSAGQSILNASLDGCVYEGKDSNRVLAVTIPYKAVVLAQNTTYTAADDDEANGVILLFTNYSGAEVTTRVEKYTSVADDFAFYYYIGAPMRFKVDLDVAGPG